MLPVVGGLLSCPLLFLEVKLIGLFPVTSGIWYDQAPLLSKGTIATPLLRTDEFKSFVPEITCTELLVGEATGSSVGGSGGIIGIGSCGGPRPGRLRAGCLGLVVPSPIVPALELARPHKQQTRKRQIETKRFFCVIRRVIGTFVRVVSPIYVPLRDTVSNP